MKTVIIESGQEAATNIDILASTRLQTVPGNGSIVFEVQASDNNATNNMTISIALPNGDIPVRDVRVPCSANATAGTAGEIDSRKALVLRFPVGQGGHPVFSCTETGDTELTWRASFIGA